MDAPQEFHYRLRDRVSGQRPGSHPGTSVGSGQEFVAHMSLFDRPDPRRLDLRASLRTLNGGWLVRVNRQRTGVAVRAIVDVSASMTFGSHRPKLHVVADFLEALGLSAFRVGDAVGMLAFDQTERSDLFIPARVSRGMGSIMASALRTIGEIGVTEVHGERGGAQSYSSLEVSRMERSRGTRRTVGSFISGVARRRSGTGAVVNGGLAGSSNGRLPLGTAVTGLMEAASHLAGQQGLIFLVSDFHWPLGGLNDVLDLLAHGGVVPVVVWDAAEIEPPERDALATLRDAESGAHRTLWVRPKLRQDWRQAVIRRRDELKGFFASHAIRPFFIEGSFDADALSRYFFEADT